MNLIKFHEWLQLNKNSPKTVKAYYQQINRFANIYKEFNQDNLNNYFIKLKEDGKSNNSLDAVKRAVIAYVEFSGEKIELPKWQKRIKRQIKYYFTEDNLVNVTTGYYDDKYLVLRFMFYTGARPSEIKDLKKDHINFDTKDIIFYNAKGNKDRVVPFLNNKLYNEMKNHCEKLSRDNVFAVSYKQLTDMFKRIKHEMKIADHEIVEPRTMRISFAKHCLSVGMDISYLKKLMGHSSIKITELYAEPDEKMIKDLCEKIRKGE